MPVAICTSSLKTDLFTSLLIFRLGRLFFDTELYELYILEIKPLLGASLVNIFSQSVSCLFILFMIKIVSLIVRCISLLWPNIAKYHRMGDLNNRNEFSHIIIILELEVQDQGVSRVSFFEDLPPWLLDGCFLPLSSAGLPSVCICVLISFSYENTSLTGVGATLSVG